MGVVIKVENLSKQYRLGTVGASTFKEDIHRYLSKIKGKKDPYFDFADLNDRTKVSDSNFVWSLKDINFEVNQGDVLGIIGRNGAGKSTLLKILSKVTAPTLGTIKAKGRIASLLEVGTGFHPELTGRENIYLNGAILGMRKLEIKRKLDEIIAFAGVEKYIDTPVKRYSSGMYVRLAFAVAAHLENEILIIDEVLAVGDSEFQKKCLGKMGEVSKGEGRTVLFVSHNISAVKILCNKTLLLKNGCIDNIGETSDVINSYLNTTPVINSVNDYIDDHSLRRGNGEVRFSEIKINEFDDFIDPTKQIIISFKFKVLKPISELFFYLVIKSPDSIESLTSTKFIELKDEFTLGEEYNYTLTIKPNLFRTGLFPLFFWLGKMGEFAADNYSYDTIDSVYFLNLKSELPDELLGYDSLKPNGYLNIDYLLNK